MPPERGKIFCMFAYIGWGNERHHSWYFTHLWRLQKKSKKWVGFKRTSQLRQLSFPKWRSRNNDIQITSTMLQCWHRQRFNAEILRKKLLPCFLCFFAFFFFSLNLNHESNEFLTLLLNFGKKKILVVSKTKGSLTFQSPLDLCLWNHKRSADAVVYYSQIII